MVEIKVVDVDDQEVATGSWGEILIKGPNVMIGYWNRPEDTEAALRDGWFHTGDVGYLDPDGYVFLVDRVKDMINAGGFKIWPREVEEVLYRHPAIKECAVVGVPDALTGEVARAVVVLQPGADLTAAALEAYCRAHMATYKVPRQIEFTMELPKKCHRQDPQTRPACPGPTCRGDLMIRLEKDGCGISAAVLLQGVPYGDRAMV